MVVHFSGENPLPSGDNGRVYGELSTHLFVQIVQAQDILKKGEQLVEATALTAIHKLTRRRVHPVVNLDKGDKGDQDEVRDDFDEDGTAADEGYDAEFIR